MSKIHLDAKGRQLGPHKDRKEKQHSVDEVHEGEQKSLSLTKDDFETARRNNEVSILRAKHPCNRTRGLWLAAHNHGVAGSLQCGR